MPVIRSLFQTRFFISIFLFLISAHAFSFSSSEPELLSPDQAYVVSGEYTEDNKIKIHWEIADGYYLYKNKFLFISDTAGIDLQTAEYPEGIIKKDPFFGEIEIYKKAVDIIIPINRVDNTVTTLNLKLRSQGCADIGICFPPHRQSVSITLPKASIMNSIKYVVGNVPVIKSIQAPFSSLQDPFSALNDLSNSLGINDDDGILSPEDAFKMTVDVVDGNTLKLHWDIADATYLYQHKLKFDIVGKGIKIGSYELPKAKIKHDSVKPDGTLGDVAAYYKSIDITVPLIRTHKAAQEITLNAQYQGCADRGICYPPSKRSFKLSLPAVDTLNTEANTNDLSSNNAATEELSEQDEIADFLSKSNSWLVIGSFFLIGLLLSFTPCVFPMIPILSGIIAGQGDNISSKRAFTLSLVYVLAMALTYTVVGVLVAGFGANIQAIFQDPWVIGSFAAVFVLLSLSMFGFFELQLPSALQSKITSVSNNQKSGSLVGVAVMGLLSALIVGPCIAPPLAGVLIYISQTGDAVLGGLALFAMSMGMGAPLIVIGTSAGKLLPKAGSWMDAIKAAFGVMLLGVAIYLLERVIPASVSMLLWGTLLVVSSIYLGALNSLNSESTGWAKLRKGFGIAILTYGILFYVGVAANGNDTLQPLRGLAIGGGSSSSTEANHLPFKRIKTTQDLDRELAAAKASGKAVMLDFYADWCIYCIQMEKNTFTDPKVRSVLDNFVILQADVTEQDDADIALQKRLGVTAPPAILFWKKSGDNPRNLRIMGFMGPEEFYAHLGKVTK